MTSRIICADVLDGLASLADESVQCCITSPPYWGLRDYGVPGRAWGGDSKHAHVWGAEIRVHATNHVDKRRWNHARNGRGEEQPTEKRPGWKRQSIGQGCYCQCGAWFGVLGLEPTPELYVLHVVEVFREVRRALRNDGTLWLNLGDSYATGAGKVGDCPGGGKQGERFRGANPTNSKRGTNIGPAVQPNRMPLPGLKPKDLVGIPWRVAFALQADGWYLRSDIIWHKPNPMPESVTDRPTKAHEYLFLLAKSGRYFYDAEAIKEPASADTHARYARGRSDAHKWADGGPGNQTIAKSFEHMRKLAPNGSGIKNNASFDAAMAVMPEFRNRRSVWTIATQPFKGAHFATFPEKLVEPCVLAGSRPGDTILDSCAGSGTVGVVARKLGRDFIGIELNPTYAQMARERIGIDESIAA